MSVAVAVLLRAPQAEKKCSPFTTSVVDAAFRGESPLLVGGDARSITARRRRIIFHTVRLEWHRVVVLGVTSASRRHDGGGAVAGATWPARHRAGFSFSAFGAAVVLELCFGYTRIHFSGALIYSRGVLCGACRGGAFAALPRWRLHLRRLRRHHTYMWLAVVVLVVVELFDV